MTKSADAVQITGMLDRPKKKLRRQSLHLEVAEQIREMIIEGELFPGHRISEGSLSDQFGISRTPMREALKVLANDGLVEIKPNRGTHVTEITLDDIDDLFEAASSIERIAGELATDRMTEADLNHLKSINKEMEGCFENGLRHEYFKLNQKVHKLIIELSGNSILLDIHESLALKVRRARFFAILSLDRWEESVREHAKILEAIEARNKDLAGKLIANHVIRTGVVVKQTFNQQYAIYRSK
jgi:DNA-binding GntR family transcriptional regulator